MDNSTMAARAANRNGQANSRLALAMKFVSWGWCVFPCHWVVDGRCSCGDPKCEERGGQGKHPLAKLVPNGRDDATTDPDVIRGWWDRFPRANVAVATGPESGIAVLDLDVHPGDEVDVARIPARYHTPVVQRTGSGGLQLFYRHVPGVRNGTNVLAEGIDFVKQIDVRAEGGYVVVPPSKNGKGKYRWLSAPGPERIASLPPFPHVEKKTERRNRQRAKVRADGDIIPQGQRNDRLIREGGRLRALGRNESQIAESLLRFNRENCVPPLDEAEVRGVAESAAKYPAGLPNPRPPEQRPERPLTDAGNAELLADLFANDLRFDHARQEWLVWRGHRWKADEDGELVRRAKDAARQRQRDALDMEDKDKREKRLKWGSASESRVRIEAAIALARSTEPLSDPGGAWDKQPELLGCENGVVDLRTGELRDGQREDRISLVVPHNYNPAAKCPRWKRFMQEILPDPEVRKFVALAIGYSMTGHTREQCFFILNGSGANGKTTMLEILRMVLGANALNMPFNTFTAKYGGHSQSNDLARLPGKRLVCASESGEASALDEARLKTLSGEDQMTARQLYKEFFDFRPVCKLWLSCNHRPQVRDETYAFWRRVKCIDFPTSFRGAKADPNLKAELEAEAEGILAWCVRHARLYLELGKLEVPDAVQLKTTQYQEETNPLAEFLAERCWEGAERTEAFPRLYEAYVQWAKENNMRDREVLSRKKFGSLLKDRFGAPAPRPGNRGPQVYTGLKLRGQEPREPGSRG